MEQRETVGKIASDLLLKTPETSDVIELERSMQEDYIKNLIDTCNNGIKKYSKDFFVVVITKNEKLMPNVFRNYYFDRSTCPTPDYDQSVYKYDYSRQELEYIWTIPSKDACHHLKDNALQVQEKRLLDFVLAFADGSLYKLAKKFNGEIA